MIYCRAAKSERGKLQYTISGDAFRRPLFVAFHNSFQTRGQIYTIMNALRVRSTMRHCEGVFGNLPVFGVEAFVGPYPYSEYTSNRLKPSIISSCNRRPASTECGQCNNNYPFAGMSASSVPENLCSGLSPESFSFSRETEERCSSAKGQIRNVWKSFASRLGGLRNLTVKCRFRWFRCMYVRWAFVICNKIYFCHYEIWI